MKLPRHLFASALAACFAANSPRAAEIAEQPTVWAHYTPWHTPLNSPISAYSYYNYPIFRSSGNDRDDWTEEFRQARAQGIDGFFTDIVFKPEGRPAFDDTTRKMLQAAEGTGFLIGLCLDVKTTVEIQTRELARMLSAYGAHPNYPRHHGKPVVATYTWGSWTPAEWAQIRAALKSAGHDIYLIANVDPGYAKLASDRLESYSPYFDSAYAFSLAGLNGMGRRQMADLVAGTARAQGKDYMATLYPGYYGAWLNGRNDFYQPHRGFDQLHDTFLAIRPGRDRWLHLTTWNDHDETSLLPMLFTTANPLLIKAYTDNFKNIAPTSTLPDICLAWHREVIPGTLLRIEAINLPGLARAPVSVKGRLLDRDGKTAAVLNPRDLDPAAFDRTEWLIPTSRLARSPFLVPEITISSPGFEHTAKLPPILLVNGWQQNAVTVKIPVRQYLNLQNTLTIRATSPETIEANITFDNSGSDAGSDAAGTIATATLFRNDRPVAPVGPSTHGKTLMNLYLKGAQDYTITTDTGEFLDATRKFSEKNSPDFSVSPRSLTSRRSLAWAPAGVLCAVKPDTQFTLTSPGKEPLRMTARELATKELLHYGKLQAEFFPADPTNQNHPPLNNRKGNYTISLLSSAQRVSDMFYVRYETTDGRVALSDIIYPFAPKNRLQPATVVETSINLETSSGASGMKGESEYLSKDIPFRAPSVVATQIPPESIRSGHWSFDGHGRDTLGDMPVTISIPATCFAEQSGRPGKFLELDGTHPIKMRLRTWPIGNATVDFMLNPAPLPPPPPPASPAAPAPPAAIQSIIGRRGWSDAININLLPDGRIEVIRDGNETVPVEKLVSKTPLLFGQWSRLRVTNDSTRIRIYINNRLDAEAPIRPARSYGNSTWFVGGGYKDYANYRGKIDDLTVHGAALAPGD
ncbi:MAG: laminin G [Opitutaceae bacterium]|jgi:hypothetical protein|nr:laminin G [Opitutaceae bacterium]